MYVFRTSLLMLAFAGVAMGVVHIRTEQARSASAVLRHEAEWARLRCDLWELQTRVARLKAPGRVHESIRHIDLSLMPPKPATPKAVPVKQAPSKKKPAKSTKAASPKKRAGGRPAPIVD